MKFRLLISLLVLISASCCTSKPGSIPEGTLEDSERVLQKALCLDPGNIYAHYELARTYIEMGRQQDARDHLQTVLDLHPDDFQSNQIQKKSREMLRQ